MYLTNNDPEAYRWFIYLLVDGKWELQSHCIEAEDGENGYVIIERIIDDEVKTFKKKGNVMFTDKPREKDAILPDPLWPCEVCPDCGGHKRVCCDCVPRDVVPVDEMVGQIGCPDCDGDGDHWCFTCQGHGAIPRCTCDAQPDDKCPSHRVEIFLYNKAMELEHRVVSLLDDIEVNMPRFNMAKKLQSDLDVNEAEIRYLKKCLAIAKEALIDMANGNIFYPKDFGKTVLEELESVEKVGDV